MIRMLDIPTIWFTGSTPRVHLFQRITRYFPSAISVERESTGDLIQVLEGFPGKHVLVIDEDIYPYSSMPHYLVDQLLLDADISMGFLSRNLVNGSYEARPTPAVWPVERFARAVEIGNAPWKPDVCIPTTVASWCANPDQLTTYRNAYNNLRSWREEATSGDSDFRISARASFGADERFGYEWIVGACRGLLSEGDDSSALLDDIALIDGGAPVREHAETLASQLRSDSDYRVFVLSEEISRLLKPMIFSAPEAQRFMEVARIYRKLGGAGASRAALYDKASAQLV